ncbi:MAG: SDR family NAD(P)-dependent oxidoreductase [Bacteroidales bacterium]|nr:SDR family NAD(P)-dependent oxidoreductase [Bacteroidales bacterium]
MHKIALVTGATSGIGEAIAKKFAHNNIDVIVSGRRIERLHALKAELEKETDSRIMALQMDVTRFSEVESAIKNLPDEWQTIEILVNNAGLASGRDKFHEGDIGDWELMIDTNVKGLMYVSRLVIPLMISHGQGLVINIGSIAGREVYPGGNVYCASKFAVDALTKGLRIDLLGENIKVSQIAPGLVETEFSLVRFKGDQQKAEKVYEGFLPLGGNDIADIAFYLTTLPLHVCINDIVVTPLAQANSVFLNRK